MATIAQIVEQIRTAIFGKDVRENIAQGIEKCYTDVSSGATIADTAANNANNKATAAQNAATEANTAASNANSAANAANTAATNANTAVENIDPSLTEKVDNAVEKTEEKIANVNNWFSDELGIKHYLFTKGGWVKTTTTVVDPTVIDPNNSYHCIIDCSEGDVFNIKASGVNSSHRPYTFIDSNNNVLDQATTNSVNSNKTAPQNSAKLIINASSSYEFYCIKGDSKINYLEMYEKYSYYGISNRFNKSKSTHGYRIKVSNGSLDEASNCGVTDFIECKTGDLIIRNAHMDSAVYGDAFYDKDKNLIGTRTSSTTTPFFINVNNCYYIRCTYYLSVENSFSVAALSSSNKDIKDSVDTVLISDIGDTEERTVPEWTQGHVFEYKNNVKTRVGCRYALSNDEVVIDYSCPKTKKVRVTSGQFVYVAFTESSLTDSKFLSINFYNSYGALTWDYLDVTDESNRKNTFTSKTLNELNGGLFTDIPNNYYIEVVSYYNVSIFVWDGTLFGAPITTYSKVFFDSSTQGYFPEAGGSTIFITASCRVIMAKPGYTFIDVYQSSSSTSVAPSDKVQRLPSQIIVLNKLNYPTRLKNITVVKNYNYETGEYDPVTKMGEIEACIIAPANAIDQIKSTGFSRNIIENCNNIFNIEWECKKNLQSSGSEIFKEGVTYNGIPYRSGYGTAHFIGWHVTKHTFINAANDPDSIFYNNPSVTVPGPYYSLVCSIYASLVNRFPYPVTNYSMMHDPNVLVKIVNNPIVGEILSNGYGHCVVPMSYMGSRFTFSESVGPISRITTHYSTTPNNDWLGIGISKQYLDNFRFSCTHKSKPSIPYDIEIGSITNGSARPFKGDRCVYTSKEDVKINIKDQNANRLYYQKFNVGYANGAPTSSFTADGNPNYISITPGVNSVVLRSADSNNSHTGVELDDNSIYGIWTSVNDSQTSAPSNVEYFEWHDISTPISFNVVNGTLITDDVFWYVVTSGHNHADSYGGKTGGNFIIPYQAPAKDIDGVLSEHSDYSNYASRAKLSSTNSVKTFFKKGKFGAYIASGVVEDTPEPDPDIND